MEEIKKIAVEKLLESPYQGRLLDQGGSPMEKKELTELKKSISENGLMQPIVVRPAKKGFQVVDGHRRLEACKLLGRKEIECLVRDYSDREAQVMSVIGNLQRENLSNIEKALAFKKVLAQGVFRDKRELSNAIGKDETYVGDLLNTVNMDQRIIEDLIAHRTTNDVRLLRAIRRAGKPDENQVSEEQWEIYTIFKKEKLTRQQVQELIKTKKGQESKSFTVSRSAHKIQVELHERLSIEKRNLIRKMLEEKMGEILNFVKEV